MKLTDTQIRNAKPRPKDYKLGDGNGLYLIIASTGGKRWRMKYTFQGKERVLAIGIYPDIPLRGGMLDGVEIKGARDLAQEARLLLRQGIDPSKHKQERKKAAIAVEATFQAIAEEWLETRRPRLKPISIKHIESRLRNDIYPLLGEKPIDQITTADLKRTLDQIQKRGAIDTCHRALWTCGQVFNHAIISERVTKDVTLPLRNTYPPAKLGHRAAIVDPKGVTDLLRAIEAYTGRGPMVRNALRLAPLVFVRPGELRQWEWSEIDFEQALWTIPAEKMKMGLAHCVPLSRQALEILAEQRTLSGGGKFVFPSPRTANRPMSANAILAALRSMGFEKDEMCGHGFRAMARTILDEQLHYPVVHIEQQLAHKVSDPLGRAYNRTQHLPERRVMMQGWADYLDGI
jgi:integrase